MRRVLEAPSFRQSIVVPAKAGTWRLTRTAPDLKASLDSSHQAGSSSIAG
jgi:hypothetical protein